MKDIIDTSNYAQNAFNSIDNLIVCQNIPIITNPKAFNICCNFNIETNMCESINYIILYFNEDFNYTNGFINKYRNNISFIINGYNNTMTTDIKELNIYKGNKIEIHFKLPPTNMEKFFSHEVDDNMEYLQSIDFSYFDSSLVTNMNLIFDQCIS